METIVTINDLQELVDFIRPNSYDYVYISLGSKMNESSTMFSYPIKNNCLSSNAEYQMIPAFVRLQPEKNKILCLVIDDFHNITLHKWNIQYMQKVLNCHTNIQLVLYDQIISLTNITHNIQTLNLLFKKNICATRFLLCNYICFKSSNDTELRLENELPNKIQKAMDFKYKECFYQWFGYSFYTYNYVYHYNAYYLQKLMNFTYISNLLNKILQDNQLDIYNIESVDYELQQNKKIDKKWDQFQNSTICFI